MARPRNDVMCRFRLYRFSLISDPFSSKRSLIPDYGDEAEDSIASPELGWIDVPRTEYDQIDVKIP
jgi:hypothetical protein